jgi:hypothetical protein
MRLFRVCSSTGDQTKLVEQLQMELKQIKDAMTKLERCVLFASFSSVWFLSGIVSYYTSFAFSPLSFTVSLFFVHEFLLLLFVIVAPGAGADAVDYWRWLSLSVKQRLRAMSSNPKRLLSCNAFLPWSYNCNRPNNNWSLPQTPRSYFSNSLLRPNPKKPRQRRIWPSSSNKPRPFFLSLMPTRRTLRKQFVNWRPSWRDPKNESTPSAVLSNIRSAAIL